MRQLKFFFSGLILLGSCLPLFYCSRESDSGSGLTISHPLMNAILPPEFPAPLFEWRSEKREQATYKIALYTDTKNYSIHAVSDLSEWKPDEFMWDSLKLLSGHDKIHFTVKKQGKRKLARVTFTVSRDSVNAPILYRHMPIPFLIAEKRLDSMDFRLINIGSKQKPHTAMRGFPVCGNCHSLTADGSTIGLDLDAGLRDKGGYFVSPVDDTILFNMDNYRSWSKMEKRRTFGLFSKISPDGRYIVTTVKDRVVMKNFPLSSWKDYAYSQLFFPVNGNLAIYDRLANKLTELPGANLEEYVQSNAVWTPDGESIIFSRARALPRDSNIYEIDVKNEELINQFVERQKSFKFDLCIIPFNGGKGGIAKPIEGASNNGKSNYFPAISPDGKWLIFCQAENFMLLMPDSRLYIIPVSGGNARNLECNFNSMNSWHAWSPNSKWIVFVSKIRSPYTDMYLSHIDEEGNAAIPVLVDRAKEPEMVVNYPEFINTKAEFTFIMDYDFVELAHINKAIVRGEYEKAKQLYYKLDNQNLYFFKEDCEDLSYMLKRMGLPREAKKYDELAKHTINTTVFNK
ncbi:MAG TPA: hypothetical protein VI583_06525 [Cyclobacteriaceae bacterium]|nr:hypothetical protein [Cyclobacteriaceae bacterium]